MKRRAQFNILLFGFITFSMMAAAQLSSDSSSEEEESFLASGEDGKASAMDKFLYKRMKQDVIPLKNKLNPDPYTIPGPQEPLPGRSHPGNYWPVFPFQNQFSGGLDLDPSISRHIGGDLNLAVPSWGMLDIYGRFFNRISDTTTKFGYLNYPVNMMDLEPEDFVKLMSDPGLHWNRYAQPRLPLGKLAKSYVPVNCRPPMCNPYHATFGLGIEHDIGGSDGVEGDIDVPIPISKGLAYRFPISGKVYYDLDNITISYGHQLSPIEPFASLFDYQKYRDPRLRIPRTRRSMPFPDDFSQSSKVWFDEPSARTFKDYVMQSGNVHQRRQTPRFPIQMANDYQLLMQDFPYAYPSNMAFSSSYQEPNLMQIVQEEMDALLNDPIAMQYLNEAAILANQMREADNWQQQQRQQEQHQLLFQQQAFNQFGQFDNALYFSQKRQEMPMEMIVEQQSDNLAGSELFQRLMSATDCGCDTNVQALQENIVEEQPARLLETMQLPSAQTQMNGFSNVQQDSPISRVEDPVAPPNSKPLPTPYLQMPWALAMQNFQQAAAFAPKNQSKNPMKGRKFTAKNWLKKNEKRERRKWMRKKRAQWKRKWTRARRQNRPMMMLQSEGKQRQSTYNRVSN